MPDIFDEINLEDSSGDIFDSISLEASEPEKSNISKINDSLTTKKIASGAGQFGKSALTGALGTYGDILNLIGLSPKKSTTPGQEALYKAEFEASEKDLPFLQDEDILPRYSKLPTTEEVASHIDSEEPSSRAERYIQRAGRAVGSGATLGGSIGTLGQLARVSTIGQTAKEMGAPEWVASTLELGSLFGLKALAKSIPDQKKLKKFIEYSRDKGLTEEEISGLIKGERRLKALGKLSKKSGKSERLLRSIDEKAGGAYDSLKNEASSLPSLSAEQSGGLADKFEDVLKELRDTVKPSPDKQSAINFIEESYKNLVNQGSSPSKLINFYQDINSAVNWRAIKGGKKMLARLKDPIKETLREASPQLADDFELANTLYSRFKFLSKSLNPHTIDNLLDKGPEGALLVGLATGNPGILTKYLGANVLRSLAREMIFNPRIQNISQKMTNALKENKPRAAQVLLKTFKKEIKQENPDLFQELDSLSFEP
jgi:hypothetical protein